MPVINKKIKGVQITHNQSTHQNDANTRHVTDTEKGNWNGAVTKANDWDTFKTSGGSLTGVVNTNKSIHVKSPDATTGTWMTFSSTHGIGTVSGKISASNWNSCYGFGVVVPKPGEKVEDSMQDGYAWTFDKDGRLSRHKKVDNSWGGVSNIHILGSLISEGASATGSPTLGTKDLRWHNIYLSGTNISGSSSGHSKLPNGLILQWVTVPLSFKGQVDANATFTLPTTCTGGIIGMWANCTNNTVTAAKLNLNVTTYTSSTGAVRAYYPTSVTADYSAKVLCIGYMS